MVAASVAVMMTVNGPPATVGVPEIVPVVELMVKPAGSPVATHAAGALLPAVIRLGEAVGAMAIV